MTINTKISARIAALVVGGVEISKAFDMVLGAGAYAKMAAEIYDSLKGK